MTKEQIKKLTDMSRTSGWAAKIGPDILAQVLCKLPKTKHDNLLVGIDTADDAAIYKVNDDLALVETLDFFTPVVDDPYSFGQIAAANSLSDVYAMGGEPVICMNIACFPKELPKKTIENILRGGYDKVTEAGALLVGGHTVDDKEPKYGLSITGYVHPEKYLSNASAKAGDILILTKPIGVGVLNTALKGGLLNDKEIKNLIEIMATLNKNAKDAMVKVGANSCTDITGFGLLGHALEMAAGSKVSINIFANKIPVIDGAIDYAKMGIIPEGTYNNKKYAEKNILIDESVEREMVDLGFDPQTSGGLLISLSKENADDMKAALENFGVKYGVIGEVLEEAEYKIYYKNQWGDYERAI